MSDSFLHPTHPPCSFCKCKLAVSRSYDTQEHCNAFSIPPIGYVIPVTSAPYFRGLLLTQTDGWGSIGLAAHGSGATASYKSSTREHTSRELGSLRRTRRLRGFISSASNECVSSKLWNPQRLCLTNSIGHMIEQKEKYVKTITDLVICSSEYTVMSATVILTKMTW
jgi:hypothetical protein